jgi:organic hydroperoxide reductase OsmC/OhrA
VKVKRQASAVWQGSLKDGKGSVSTESGVLAQAQYSFGTRFESGIGTNPEELMKKTKKRDGFILRVKRKSHPRP